MIEDKKPYTVQRESRWRNINIWITDAQISARYIHANVGRGGVI